jgi:hypothetical protein
VYFLLEQKVPKTQGLILNAGKIVCGAKKDELVRHTTPDSDSVFFYAPPPIFLVGIDYQAVSKAVRYPVQSV